MSLDTFGAKKTLVVEGKNYTIFALDALEGSERLPYSLKILAENLLRHEDDVSVTADDVRCLVDADSRSSREIQFRPARVVMQDFTGVPCLVDLATMREAMEELGGDPRVINPICPAEMVIDHSVIADAFGTRQALAINTEREYSRNRERYQFLKWGQKAFSNFTVVPPGAGIVHQVNIEHLARVVFDDDTVAYPDSCVGTDSHTTMVNGLGVLGWGVGGIEAEAAMLGQPISMLIPRVVGFKLTGHLPATTTATDVVLTITQMLREHNVVGKFVEFYGPGIADIPVANRATIGNMSPEYGSTAAIFPIDQLTIDYLRLTGRDSHRIALVESYAKTQGLWWNPDDQMVYDEYIELDLSTVVPSIAGPKRPQDRIRLDEAHSAFNRDIISYSDDRSRYHEATFNEDSHKIAHGAIGIAAITSCTNTSNPSVMIAAGLVAKKAVEAGLTVPPWVKTTLAPGSQVVTRYLDQAGLTSWLDRLGFTTVGYGCTTCIGNSGPLVEQVSAAARDGVVITSVLSGNRNFEGRINPDVAMNYLASPPLVVAYALGGTMDIDLMNDPIGYVDGKAIMLDDIWPSREEIDQIISAHIDRTMYLDSYRDIFEGDQRWKDLDAHQGQTFRWDESSTYIRKAPYFDQMSLTPNKTSDICSARVLARLGDSVTTDHISPAGAIAVDSPAACYLRDHRIEAHNFNSYGSRRGNHEVMVRGTFANIRLKNQIVQGRQGGWTRDFTKESSIVPIYDAAMNYRRQGIDLVILAGAEYGSGSSRDWAAKGTMLLGVRAVLAVSYERIHRSNLVGMGVLPLQFKEGQSADTLGLTGEEVIDIFGIAGVEWPKNVQVEAQRLDGSKVRFEMDVRIDTPGEWAYYRHGGIMPFVLRTLYETHRK